MIAVDLAYAIGDLLLLGFVVAVFGLTGWRPGRALLLVGAALVTSAIVDGWFLYNLATGQTVDTTLVATLWPAAALLIGCAAWQRPAEAQPIRLEGWRVLLMPSAFALSGLALLGYHAIEPQNALALALAVATLAAVIVRMAVTFRENIELLDSSRREALTDALTGLRNRRALIADLEEAAAGAGAEEPVALVILDLDGFKQYNDRFGHPMGDALLVRLARKLEVAAGRFDAPGYRLGGDEFCVLAACRRRARARDCDRRPICTQRTGRGLRRHEHLWLRRHPGRRPRCGQRPAHRGQPAVRAQGQSPALIRRQLRPARRCCRRCRSASQTCGTTSTRSPSCRCGSATRWVCRGRSSTICAQAAHLHDVGKMAVPDAILQKPGGLDPVEWERMRQHTIAGERILNAAPALSHVAALVRSSHERYDGTGYPDGIAGTSIPLGARIITACDAYHSMTSRRTYGAVVGAEAALAELRRCAGRQFDPRVVDGDVCGARRRGGAADAVEERVPAAQLSSPQLGAAGAGATTA